MAPAGINDLERFSGVIAIQRAIGDARGDLATIMHAIVSEMSVMPQANGIVVELRDADQIYYAAASGTSADLVGLRLSLKSSLSGLCVLTGEPQFCVDAESDPRVNLEACRRVGLRSMIVIPIPHRGQTVGVLKYHAAEPGAFGEADVLMAHLLVGPIAVGMSSVGEADAVRAQTELRELVEMKDRLVSTVSHELRTPVTSIAGSLDLLRIGAGGALPAQAADLVGIAGRNAARLKRLVNDLLDMGKLGAGGMTIAPVELDLVELVQDAVEQSLPFAEQTGVVLRYQAPARPIIATTDGERLIQALTNLLSNAAKFSPAGSTVSIELSSTATAFTIRVCDQGPGVPIEFRPRLFDQFSQTGTPAAKDFPGTGLGLAITKGIAKLLGGDVRLDESYRQGAAFEIELPRSIADAAAQVA